MEIQVPSAPDHFEFCFACGPMVLLNEGGNKSGCSLKKYELSFMLLRTNFLFCVGFFLVCFYFAQSMPPIFSNNPHA